MTPVVDGPFGGGVESVVISGSQVHDTVKQFVPGFQVQAFEVFLVCLVGRWCRSARVPQPGLRSQEMLDRVIHAFYLF